MTRILSALVALLMLAACAGGGRGRTDYAVYDLGPAAPRAAATAAHAGLALDVRLPAWLDNPAMSYRLDYADAQRVRVYAQARWVASPLLLLQQRLRQQLAATTAGAPCTVRIELDDFSQSFASPTSSSARLTGEALLLGKGGVVRQRRPLQIEVPAPTPDAAGGALALAGVADRLSSTLIQWLRDQDLAACRAAG